MIFNPRYGATGMLAMPFYLIFEMLGPFVEFLGYVIFAFFLATGQLNSPFAVRFFLLAVVYGMILSLSALLIEEFSLQRFPRLSDVVWMAVLGILENIVYRQWLVLVRFKAFFDLMRGDKGWGSMEKKGFTLEHEQP